MGLADQHQPVDTWSFALLSLEVTYQAAREMVMRQGHVLTRSEFAGAAGHLIVTPGFCYQLWDAGLDGFAWQPLNLVRVKEPISMPNGVNRRNVK